MKDEYIAPQLEVLGELRGVTSALGPYGSGDILGTGTFSPPGDEETGGIS